MTLTRLARLLSRTALPLLLAFAAGQSAMAQPAKPADDPDTLVLSDTLEYDDIKRSSVFTGNVILTRGPLTLTADRLLMHEDAEGFQHGTATVEGGKLVVVRQEMPEKFEVLEAKGVRSEYNGKTEEFTMIGKAVVTRYICGKRFDSVQGERVIYRQKTDTYQAFGGPNSAAQGGRVRSLTKPRAQAEAAVAACRKSGGA